MRTPTLAVTGGNHYDLLVRLPRLPQPNDRLSAEEAVIAPGGMGGNLATAFARLGGRARFVGSFTDDEDGAALRADMNAEGIDTTWSTVRPSADPQRGFILVGEDGARAILGLPFQGTALRRSSSRAPDVWHRAEGAAWTAMVRRHLQVHPLPSALFDPPLDGFSCPGAFAPAIIPRLPTSLPLFIDIETGHLDGMDDEAVATILRRASIIFGNEENLYALRRRLAFDSLRYLAATADMTIVETRGAAGCSVHTRDESHDAEGFVVDAIDTTGAGDCFAAAFIFATLGGMLLPNAAQFANAAAALSTRRLGSRSAMPSLDEVEALLATRYTDTQAAIPVSVASRS